MKEDKKNIKLEPHLMDKDKYCIHYQNLKYCFYSGLQVTKGHNIISFKQSAWLK